MVSTDNLTVLDHETEIYTPISKYGDALKFILKQNNISTHISMIICRFRDKEDEQVRTYWAKRFEKAGNHILISPRTMLCFKTHFDPDELFDFLMSSLNDPDVKEYISHFESGPHISDPNILE